MKLEFSMKLETPSSRPRRLAPVSFPSHALAQTMARFGTKFFSRFSRFRVVSRPYPLPFPRGEAPRRSRDPSSRARASVAVLLEIFAVPHYHLHRDLFI